MRFGVLRTERFGGFESCRCGFEIVPIGIGESEIQEQIPFFESQTDRCAVFADLFGREARHAVGETQMIVRKRVVPLGSQKSLMQPYRGGIVSEPKRNVRRNVAFASTRRSCSPRSHGGKDHQERRDRENQSLVDA